RVHNKLPQYLSNKKRWKEGRINMDLGGGDSLIYIEPNSPGYQSFIINEMGNFFKKYTLDGYYLDGSKIYNHWTDESGEKYYPILAYRDLQRRLYLNIKEQNKDALIIAHMSGY